MPTNETTTRIMIVNTILAHYNAELIDAMMSHLHTTAGDDVAFHLAYGGPSDQFDHIQYRHKTLLDDPQLKGQVYPQNYSLWLQAVRDWAVANRLNPIAVHFTEVDHIILSPKYWLEIKRVLETSKHDVFGKTCYDCNNTNFHFYLEYRDDASLINYLTGLSTRDNKKSLWTALGDGLLMRWEALDAFCKQPTYHDCYTEILIPSVLHHLGFSLVDLDSISDIFKEVRFRPAYTYDEALALAKEGALCCHPFKERETFIDLQRYARELHGLA